MKQHELAKIIPPIHEDQYIDLKSDILDNGLLSPIVTIDGSILDGWHRFKACQELGIEPSFIEYDGNDPLSFVISMNITRRHMSRGELATFAAIHILPIEKEKAKEREKMSLGQGIKGVVVTPDLKGRARDRAGRQVGVGGRAVWMADRLMENAPDLFEKVQNNELEIYPAYDIFIKRNTEARTEKERSKKRKEKLDNMDRGVKAFLDHMRDWKVALADSIILGEAGRFSPEGAALTCRRLEEIESMTGELKEILQCQPSKED
jgi:ParB-like chromosome segregation protein Spo0J